MFQYKSIIRFLLLSTIIMCSGSEHLEQVGTFTDDTGFEFLPSDGAFKLNLEAHFEFSQLYDSVVVEGKHEHIFPLVQAFISALKGCPVSLEDTDVSILSGSKPRKPDWTQDPALLMQLVDIELDVYEILSKFYMDIAMNKSWHGPKYSIYSYLEDIEHSTMVVMENFDSHVHYAEDPVIYVATHPNLIYRMIRRFSQDLNPILVQVSQSNPEIIDRLRKKTYNKHLPNSVDQREFLAAILRIQKFGMIGTYDFAAGVFENIQTNINLHALHALEIGAHFADRSELDLAIEWLHVSLSHIKSIPHVNTTLEITGFVEQILEIVVEKHNAKFPTLFHDTWSPSVFHKRVRLPFVPEEYTRRVFGLQAKASEERNNTKWNWSIRMNHRRACAGKSFQTPEEKKNLKCWLETSLNPYWRINPLKTELLHETPPVYQIYDFIGDEVINQLKEKTQRRLIRSEVIDVSKSSGSLIDPSRTSSNTWMNEGSPSGKFMMPLVRRMELLTGLNMTSRASDFFQVGNYGASHHYDSHLDAFEDPNRVRAQGRGNRMTTITGYLSDVTVGGRTGFPTLGIAADPVKGSIVVWNNVEKDMVTVDGHSWHGGCPVVLGVKWIITKWIYSTPNMFQRKCPSPQQSKHFAALL